MATTRNKIKVAREIGCGIYFEMAVGMFLSFSSAQLLTMRDTAQAQIINGANLILTTATSGDVSSTKTWNLEPAVFWDELNFALRRAGTMSPRVSRTKIRYA